MNVIRFCNNWNNKLNCDYFTTIRSELSFKYYLSKINKVFRVELNKRINTYAKLISVRTEVLEEIDELILILDTGTTHFKPIFSNFKQKPEDKYTLLTFEKINWKLKIIFKFPTGGWNKWYPNVFYTTNQVLICMT